MRTVFVHERVLPVSSAKAGLLIDSLSSATDLLWPVATWPAMRFDRPLEIGAVGGHGPIRYAVEDYWRGRLVLFRLSGPPCLKGAVHEFAAIPNPDGSTTLRHTLELSLTGRALISWPLAWHWLHAACIEDALACGQISLGLEPQIRPWSLWVKVLRWLAWGGRPPHGDPWGGRTAGDA